MRVPRLPAFPRRHAVRAFEVFDGYVHDLAGAVDLAVHEEEEPMPRDREEALDGLGGRNSGSRCPSRPPA